MQGGEFRRSAILRPVPHDAALQMSFLHGDAAAWRNVRQMRGGLCEVRGNADRAGTEPRSAQT